MIKAKCICGLLIAIYLTLVHPPATQAYTVELTRQDLQDAVERYFPIAHASPLAKVSLYEPEVFLEQQSDRIGMEVTIAVDVPGIIKGRGQGRLDGDLEFRQQTGEFYLHDPQIRKLEIHDVPPEISASILETLQELTRQALPPLLLYTLKEWETGPAQGRLSSVTIRNGKLRLKMLPSQ